MDKIIIPIPKPRNHLVPLSRNRKAGAHAQNLRQMKRDNKKLA